MVDQWESVAPPEVGEALAGHAGLLGSWLLRGLFLGEWHRPKLTTVRGHPVMLPEGSSLATGT